MPLSPCLRRVSRQGETAAARSQPDGSHAASTGIDAEVGPSSSTRSKRRARESTSTADSQGKLKQVQSSSDDGSFLLIAGLHRFASILFLTASRCPRGDTRMLSWTTHVDIFTCAAVSRNGQRGKR